MGAAEGFEAYSIGNGSQVTHSAISVTISVTMAGVRHFDPRTLDVPSDEAVARRPSMHVFQLRLAPTARYVRIVTDDDRVAGYVTSSYGDVLYTGRTPEDRTDEATLLTTTIPAIVMFNAVPLPRNAPASGETQWTSGAYIVDQFVWRALANDPDWIPLYACAVEIGGRAVVLAGAGSVGKTTLGLALANAGAGVYGDEMILIHRRSRVVSAISRRLMLRPGTLGLLGNVAITERIRAAGIPLGSGTAKRIVVGAVPRPAPLGAIMLIERGSGVPALSPLSAPRTTVALRPYLGTSIPDFDAFAALVHTIAVNRCFRLRTGDVIATAAAVGQVMSA